jgi:hypothetical protein
MSAQFCRQCNSTPQTSYYTQNSNSKRLVNQNFKFQIYLETIGHTFKRASPGSEISEVKIEVFWNLEWNSKIRRESAETALAPLAKTVYCQQLSHDNNRVASSEAGSRVGKTYGLEPFGKSGDFSLACGGQIELFEIRVHRSRPWTFLLRGHECCDPETTSRLFQMRPESETAIWYPMWRGHERMIIFCISTQSDKWHKNPIYGVQYSMFHV